jgi:hypothetical protein
MKIIDKEFILFGSGLFFYLSFLKYMGIMFFVISILILPGLILSIFYPISSYIYIYIYN